MLQAINNKQQPPPPRTLVISVRAKFSRFCHFSFILSNNNTNSISIRFKFHPRRYCYLFKIKSKPCSSWKNKFPSKILKFLRIKPPKKNSTIIWNKYLKGIRIWVWIVVAIIICNRLFTFKFIYNYAISSGLLYHIHQALSNWVSSSLLVPAN